MINSAVRKVSLITPQFFARKGTSAIDFSYGSFLSKKQGTLWRRFLIRKVPYTEDSRFNSPLFLSTRTILQAKKLSIVTLDAKLWVSYTYLDLRSLNETSNNSRNQSVLFSRWITRVSMSLCSDSIVWRRTSDTSMLHLWATNRIKRLWTLSRIRSSSSRKGDQISEQYCKIANWRNFAARKHFSIYWPGTDSKLRGHTKSEDGRQRALLNVYFESSLHVTFKNGERALRRC